MNGSNHSSEHGIEKAFTKFFTVQNLSSDSLIDEHSAKIRINCSIDTHIFLSLVELHNFSIVVYTISDSSSCKRYFSSQRYTIFNFVFLILSQACSIVKNMCSGCNLSFLIIAFKIMNGTFYLIKFFSQHYNFFLLTFYNNLIFYQKVYKSIDLK